MVPLLNIDAGELSDEAGELYELAHVLNVACGGHAGDESSMTKLAHACRRTGAALGAHPSYPDREGFGRRAVTLSTASIVETVAEQCHALASVARRSDVPLRYMKLHGALYHAAAREPDVADAALRGALEALGWEITVIGPRDGALAARALDLGMRFAVEGFADRGTRPDGSLVPRGEAGALVADPALAAERARSLAAMVDTVCVHGDGESAVAIARAVRAVLDELGRGA